MDPALREQLAESPDTAGELEAIVRLRAPSLAIPGLRVVATFGHIATCRVRRDRLMEVYRDEGVVSLKASRTLGPEATVPDQPEWVPASRTRRPASAALTGRGVVVGVVDWGCDFAHPSFRRADGTTRLLGLWDQRTADEAAAPAPYGYGRHHTRAAIDAALIREAPYEALGYHPADADRAGTGAHGTHVMDIAAGNGRGGGPVGVALEAWLAFVHLADCGTGGLANLGDSVRLLEAVDFIARIAGPRPWVINISIGRHGGPHDGSTLVEMALDELLARPGRAVVQSAGNYFGSGAHATGRLVTGRPTTLAFVTDEADLTPNELELWYSGRDELAVRLRSPAGVVSPAVPLGGVCDVQEADVGVGRLYHRRQDPNNFDNHIDLFLDSAAPAGRWTLELEPLRVSDGRFHAWLERDEACRSCQARFTIADRDVWTTTGTIANGYRPLTVGAYAASSPDGRLARFTSSGPTRDGRGKPDLVAPGVREVAARSAPAQARTSPGGTVIKSGTSMATPHVTGAVALCLQAHGHALSMDRIRSLLLGTARRPPSGVDAAERFGAGYLDIDRLVAQLACACSRCRGSPKETVMPHDLAASAIRLSMPARRLYQELVYGRAYPPPALVEDSYIVVALPGKRPSAAPRPGDVVISVALGIPGPAHVSVLADPSLAPRLLDGSGRLRLGQLLLRPRTPVERQLPARGPDDDEAGEDEPPGAADDQFSGPLTPAEWDLVEMWQSYGTVGTDQLTDDPQRNASLVAAAIFCGRRPLGVPDVNTDPLLCIDHGVTAADPRVVRLVPHVVSRGEIINWPSVPLTRRRVMAMELLVARGYPENGAAGLVGNLERESALLPNRVERSKAARPMHAPAFNRVFTDFTAAEVMNRNLKTGQGPLKAGVGLAQWTKPLRRAGLFAHSFGARPAGASILFDLPAQIDYLVHELQTGYAGVDAVLRNPNVTVEKASDEVLYNFEIPGSIIDQATRKKRPRVDVAVQTVFKERRILGRRALRDYRAAQPPVVRPAGPAPAPAETMDAEPGLLGRVVGGAMDIWELAAGEIGPGSTGLAVDVLQRALGRLGAIVPVTSTFDDATGAALRRVQANLGLCVSGIAGNQTKGAIARAIARITNPSADPLPEAIVRVARGELARWQRGGRYLRETDPDATPILQEYYRDGYCQAVAAADLQSAAWHSRNFWSAVFISWVMRTAGAGTGFAYARGHRTYVRAARRNRCSNDLSSPFWAYRATEVAPQLGDLVCKARSPGPYATYETVMQPTEWPLHCDIVTDVVAGAADIGATGGNAAIPGGNPNQGLTVAERRLRVDAAGMLDLTGDQNRYFAVIRCRGPAPGVPQPC